MGLLDGVSAFGKSLGTFAGNMLAEERNSLIRRSLLNNTPVADVPATEAPPVAPVAPAPAATAPAPLQVSVAGKSGIALGMRQNNPGNLSFAGQPGATPGSRAADGQLVAAFPDMPSGVAATAQQLATYQTVHGVDTVKDAVARWVLGPKGDPSTPRLQNYIGNVAAAIGVRPDAKIDLTDPVVQAKFILAQQPHESGGGGAVLDPNDVIKGVQMAALRNRQTAGAP